MASVTIFAKRAKTVEEAAIALATHTSEDRIVVFTNSQTAARNNLKRRLATKAIGVLKRMDNNTPPVNASWGLWVTEEIKRHTPQPVNASIEHLRTGSGTPTTKQQKKQENLHR